MIVFSSRLLSLPILGILTLVVVLTAHCFGQQELSDAEWQLIEKAETSRIAAIEKAMPSVIAVYGEDRAGGGSGVIIHPNGLALTNHHVIMGAGVAGWGGLSDGNLYRWKLIGTDPGGDVAVIQMMGLEEFPCSKLADSDLVRVGDWAIAMGNPFILSEDQKPTVTLGIVSGVRRYQPGAGNNQLVYGNCIQTDTSINPGNSGGPLFNMQSEVIGINGRVSIQDRGRVNVGLGYAISSNQVKNFLPDLMATKLMEHGTLDANFSNRGGRVICSTINELSAVAQMGLQLRDRLLEFEGQPITSANQFTNLICTLPEEWPAHLKVEKPDGAIVDFHVRLTGLPYSKPPEPELPNEPTPEQQKQIEQQMQIVELLRHDPGVVRNYDDNRFFSEMIWEQATFPNSDRALAIAITDNFIRDGEVVGTCVTRLLSDGVCNVVFNENGKSPIEYVVSAKQAVKVVDGVREELTAVQMKLDPFVVQALAIMHVNKIAGGFDRWGSAHLDGGDKSRGNVAARFKFEDDDQDWFYAWVTMADPVRQIEAVLSKASADLDCEGKGGGVTFDRWAEQKCGWQVPQEKQFVVGLSEMPAATLQLKSVEEMEAFSFAEMTRRLMEGEQQ
ncbi:MAG: trypsin-like peptidase domain-containing protein [Pirellulaceae bacterium]